MESLKTEYDDGIIEVWNIKGTRLSFKLNNKWYNCFKETFDKANEIFTSGDKRKIHIEYTDNEKDGKVFHNVSKIELAEAQSEIEIKDTKQFNAPFFGMCCNQAVEIIKIKFNKEGIFNWEEYEKWVKMFYEHNEKIRDGLNL
jgi:hypothetical protein